MPSKVCPICPQQSREVKGTGRKFLAKPMQGQNNGLNIYRIKRLLRVHNCRQAVSKLPKQSIKFQYGTVDEEDFLYTIKHFRYVNM